jgi:hypothetical protein
MRWSCDTGCSELLLLGAFPVSLALKNLRVASANGASACYLDVWIRYPCKKVYDSERDFAVQTVIIKTVYWWRIRRFISEYPHERVPMKSGVSKLTRLGEKYCTQNYFQLHDEGKCSAAKKLATELRDKTKYSGSATWMYKIKKHWTETLQQFELRSFGQFITLEFQ